MATRTIDPTELRNRFTAARRMPQLLEVRDHVRVAIRQTSDEMDAGDGNGMAELQALFAQLKGLLDQIDEKITRTATIDDLERRMSGQPLGFTGDQQWDRAQCQFSISRAIASQVPEIRDSIDAGREREISAELVRRGGGRTLKGIAVPIAALSVRIRDCSPALLRQLERRDIISTDRPVGGPGGNLIATVLDPSEYIDVLRPAIAVRQLGARVISNLVANLDLPRQTKASDSGWFAENTAIMRSDIEHDLVQLRPRHVGAILEFSRNMLLQATPDIESVIRSDLAAVLARRIDLAAIAGAGTAVEPLGIVTDPAVPHLDAAVPSYDGLVDLTTLLAEANALEGSLGWLASATVRGALLKLKDQMARPYGLDLLFQGFPYAFSNLAGGPAAVPHPIVFANFSDLVIGMWDELSLLTNPFETEAFSKGNVLVRGACTIDVQKRHNVSFSYMSTVPDEGVTAARAPAASPHGAGAPSRSRS